MYKIELNNAVPGSTRPAKDMAALKETVEICEALFYGKDEGINSQKKDSVARYLASTGSRAAAGDVAARVELSEIVKFIIEPHLRTQMKALDYLGHYQKIGMDKTAVIRVPSYEGVEARVQATGGSFPFGATKWTEQTVNTTAITAGVRINYRALSSGNFDGSIAEEIAQAQTDMFNKIVLYTLGILRDRLKKATGVKFYSEYSGAPTKQGVDEMLTAMHPFGKVNVVGDYTMLAAINGFQGFKEIGANTVPFYSEEMVNDINKTGLYGWYNGAVLSELPNPYDLTRPLADNSGFEKYYDENTSYFIPSGNNSPLWMFERGDLSTMTGNDVNTGDVLTRFDMEFGADVVKGREYQIGMIAKAE